MAERWTPETEELVARATGAHYLRMDQIDADGNSPCVCGQWAENATEIGWDDHMAEVTLTALADAGLLVTPQLQAVLDAARTWVGRCHREPGHPDHPNQWADDEDFALMAAVDAHEELYPRRLVSASGAVSPRHPAQQFDGGVDHG